MTSKVKGRNGHMGDGELTPIVNFELNPIIKFLKSIDISKCSDKIIKIAKYSPKIHKNKKNTKEFLSPTVKMVLSPL